MSTAGKVLSVLTLLLALVWVLLASAVTQLNRSGAKAVEDLKTQVAKLTEDVAKAKTDLQGLIDQTYQERLKTQKDLTVLQIQQSEVEKARAQVLEDSSHLKFQLDSLLKTIKTAQTVGEQRQAEREAETKLKAEAEMLVEKLKADNAELRTQLDGLREKFRATLSENKALVNQLLRVGGTLTTSRPVSLVR